MGYFLPYSFDVALPYSGFKLYLRFGVKHMNNLPSDPDLVFQFLGDYESLLVPEFYY